MRWLYFLMGLLISLFPILNFNFRCFRSVSRNFYHHFESVAPELFSLPQNFQRFIRFSISDFVLVAIFIGLCFVKKVKLKELFFNSHSRYLTLFIIGAFISIMCSIFSSYYFQYTTLLHLTLAFLGFYLVYVLYRNRPDLIRPTLYAFLSVTALECVIGIGQFLMQHHLGLQFLSEPMISPNIKSYASFSLADGKEFFNGLLPWIQSGHNLILRPYGTFIHPNIFGGYLCISLFLSYYAFLTSENRFVRVLLLICIPVQILTLVLTFSRGAVFAWFIGSVAFFSLGFMKKTVLTPLVKKDFLKLILLVGIALLITLVLLFGYLKDRGGFVNINSLTNASDAGRFLLFRLAILLFLHAPFIGIGYNGFALFPYGSLAPDLAGANPMGDLSHNIYLQTAAETGLLGLSLLILFILSLYKPFLKKRFTPLSLTFATIFFCMLLIGVVDHYWLTQVSGRLMFFLFGGLFAASTSFDKEVEKNLREV